MVDKMWMELRNRTQGSIDWIDERLNSDIEWSHSMITHWKSRRSAYISTLKRMDEIENYYAG